jgi:hypothetical protein
MESAEKKTAQAKTRLRRGAQSYINYRRYICKTLPVKTAKELPVQTAGALEYQSQ